MKIEQDELKGKSLDQISALIKTLNSRIASKKAELDPILKKTKSERAKVDVNQCDDHWLGRIDVFLLFRN
jgi:hypothetical protein